MTHHYKILTISALVGSLVTLTGCIVDPGHNNAYGSSTGSYNQPQHAGSSHSSASGAAEWDRGCADAKAGSYDRSGKAGQAHEDGWQACKNGAQQQNGNRGGNSEYDRGCADAKAGSYDRSGKAGQAYEDGWQACKSGAQSQGGVETAKQACNGRFGGNGQVQTVSPLKPGFWEIIMSDNYGRKIACTVDTYGNISDWVEMK